MHHTALLIVAGLVFLVVGGSVAIAGWLATGGLQGGSQASGRAFFGALAAAVIGFALLILALLGM